MNANQNKVLHSLLAQHGWMDQKVNLVRSVTNGRTASSKEMNIEEAAELINYLKSELKTRWYPMRNKVVHLLCLYGMTKEDGKPDYYRIDGFIKNIGKNNPKKKKLNYLSVQEVLKVLNQVEVMVNKELGR